MIKMDIKKTLEEVKAYFENMLTKEYQDYEEWEKDINELCDLVILCERLDQIGELLILKNLSFGEKYQKEIINKTLNKIFFQGTEKPGPKTKVTWTEES
jgi:hypothetical protein